MLTLALWLNVIILVPAVVLLVTGTPWVIRMLGQATPARSMLLAVYLSVLAATVLFLVWPLEPGIITLIALQISATTLSAFTLRVLTNPFVIGNLLFAAVHTALLVLHGLPT